MAVSADEQSAALIAVSGHYKDRLHAIQTAEWQVYYGIWIVILFSVYLLLTTSHQILIDLAEGLRSQGIAEINIRTYRCEGVVCLLTVFYISIWYYYFRLFYPKNYESIDDNRRFFEYYINSAVPAGFLINSDHNENHLLSPKCYLKSRIYKGRVIILTKSMSIFLVLAAAISYLGPIRQIPMAIEVAKPLESLAGCCKKPTERDPVSLQLIRPSHDH